MHAPLVGAQTVTLQRGAPIGDSTYWSCEDTVLSRELPDGSFGQGELLPANRSTRVLVRFGDLVRALGPNKRIVDAKLVLTPLTVTGQQDLDFGDVFPGVASTVAVSDVSAGRWLTGVARP